jgi:hypothetical protein
MSVLFDLDKIKQYCTNKGTLCQGCPLDGKGNFCENSGFPDFWNIRKMTAAAKKIGALHYVKTDTKHNATKKILPRG